jgi:anti-anti-sigma regulatory factor
VRRLSDPLTCFVDDLQPYTVITFDGRLDVAGLARARAVMMKALAEQPSALLLDLSGVTACDPAALSVFYAARLQAARWPSVSLVLCAPSPPLVLLLARARSTQLPVYDSVGQAVDQVDDVAPAVLREDLLPVSGAGRRAREIVTEACLRWGRSDLVGPASIVVTELVNNVTEHAGTMSTLTVARRSRTIQIAVRDGSSRPPHLVPGAGRDAARGLRLVDAEASSWGHLIVPDGKVVWAALR